MAATSSMMRARDPALIKAAMQARGRLTYRELGILAGSTYGTVAFILAGRGTSRDTAKRIARTLRRPVDELFEPVSSSGKQQNEQKEAAA